MKRRKHPKGKSMKVTYVKRDKKSGRFGNVRITTFCDPLEVGAVVPQLAWEKCEDIKVGED